jgi:hypothetical protein
LVKAAAETELVEAVAAETAEKAEKAETAALRGSVTRRAVAHVQAGTAMVTCWRRLRRSRWW